jgi:hypothetical protein
VLPYPESARFRDGAPHAHGEPAEARG